MQKDFFIQVHTMKSEFSKFSPYTTPKDPNEAYLTHTSQSPYWWSTNVVMFAVSGYVSIMHHQTMNITQERMASPVHQPHMYPMQHACHNCRKQNKYISQAHIDGLVQDCSNSIANALELLQSFIGPLICILATCLSHFSQTK